jgi:hypothetical protein
MSFIFSSLTSTPSPNVRTFQVHEDFSGHRTCSVKASVKVFQGENLTAQLNLIQIPDRNMSDNDEALFF